MATEPTLGEVKNLIEAQGTAFEEFKKTNDERLAQIEKKGVADPVTADKLAKIETALAGKAEDLNQKVTTAAIAQKNMQDQLDRVETALKRPALAMTTAEDKREALKQKINDFIRLTIKAYSGHPLMPDQQKVLIVSDDTLGGYLAPVEYVREIIKSVVEISPIRSIARTRTTMAKSIQLPKRTAQFAAAWVAEAASRTETTGLTFGMEEIPVHECYALVDVSHANLEDSAFDLEAFVTEEAVEQFAKLEGAAFVTGTGMGRPEGYATNTAVGRTNSGSAATIADVNGQANGLISLRHALKTEYTRGAVWTLNRTTLGAVRRLKDANNNYIWQMGLPGLHLGIPATILGDPYVEVPDHADEAAAAVPIFYGDFRRAYTIVDRIQMASLRDPYTQATSGNIRLLWYRRVGGQVVLAEAIRGLRCQA